MAAKTAYEAEARAREAASEAAARAERETASLHEQEICASDRKPPMSMYSSIRPNARTPRSRVRSCG